MAITSLVETNPLLRQTPRNRAETVPSARGRARAEISAFSAHLSNDGGGRSRPWGEKRHSLPLACIILMHARGVEWDVPAGWERMKLHPRQPGQGTAQLFFRVI